MSKTEGKKPYTDPETLERLYVEEGMSTYDIGDKFGVGFNTIIYHMEKHGIERRKDGYELDHVPLYYTADNGFRWQHEYDYERDHIAVPRLIAIAEGADPHEVFGDSGKVVTHNNDVMWDDRPDNISLVPRGSWNRYSRSDMLDWLHAFVNEFGVVPSENDIQGWPGPSATTYADRFGSFSDAVKEAGYTPRGESDE